MRAGGVQKKGRVSNPPPHASFTALRATNSSLCPLCLCGESFFLTAARRAAALVPRFRGEDKDGGVRGWQALSC
jgi:hypothetical protein